jgi:aarF domain-containing kinase
LSLHILKVLSANKRVLIMEYIRGWRVDDLEFLDVHGIDRNEVAIELSTVFSQMVYLNGQFHVDPHPGMSILSYSISRNANARQATCSSD